MISDQDRKLAEETFDLIERSTDAGDNFDAGQPAITPDTTTPLEYEAAAARFHALDDLENLAANRLDEIFPWSVSLALAEHTAAEQGVCSMCAKRKDSLNENGVCAECVQACQDLAGPCTLPASTGHPHPACTLAEHTASAIDKILGA